jgi:Asp-tRNA(Asn)/Glu-tRNA(Gln) amidotransferase A subunit family amidase
MCAVLLSRFLEALGDADVMVTPTLPIAAPRFGDPVTVSNSSSSLDLFTLIQFTAIANVAGLPAVSVPVGLTASGLPVGLQVLGRPGADSDVLACARAVESTLGPLGPPPTIGQLSANSCADRVGGDADTMAGHQVGGRLGMATPQGKDPGPRAW